MILTFSGEYITQHARNLMLAKEKKLAMEYLLNVCPQFMKEDYVKILNGTHRLEGKDSLELKDEILHVYEEYINEINSVSHPITSFNAPPKAGILKSISHIRHNTSSPSKYSYNDIETFKEKILLNIENTNGTWDEFSYKLPNQSFARKISYPVELGLAFALSKTNAKHLAPVWEFVSPVGLKSESDNPLHSDLWLAIGFNIGPNVYDASSDEHQIFNQLICHIQEKHLGYDMHVLNSSNQEMLKGTFRHPDAWNERPENENTILVLPHLGIEYQSLFIQSQGVVCSQGGKLAHLTIIGREMNIPIIRHDDALLKCLTGMSVNIDFKQGKMNILPYDSLFSSDNMIRKLTI